ncbi:MAG: TIR domain-containing protein [Clostridiales Family XIII bacterium]|jgi:hypothetical protein|nr:TIR domain-containing protein [Clostridiales Family XIII bacterium]
MKRKPASAEAGAGAAFQGPAAEEGVSKMGKLAVKCAVTPCASDNGSFVFISYAHEDAKSIFPMIEAVNAAGYNVWYDKGINISSTWTDEIGKAILRCKIFVVFLSKCAIESRYVRSEVEFALNKGRKIIPVYLDEIDMLPPGLALGLNATQGIEEKNPEIIVKEILAALEYNDIAKGAKIRENNLPLKRYRRSGIRNKYILIAGAAVCVLGVAGVSFAMGNAFMAKQDEQPAQGVAAGTETAGDAADGPSARNGAGAANAAGDADDPGGQTAGADAGEETAGEDAQNTAPRSGRTPSAPAGAGNGAHTAAQQDAAGQGTAPQNTAPQNTVETVVYMDWVYETAIFAAEGKYSGEVSGGVPNGNGSFLFLSNVEETLPNGAVIAWAKGDVRQGTFSDGVLEGEGEIICTNGDRYAGGFEGGLQSGYGEMRYVVGDVYAGCYRNELRDGEGVYSFPNGETYAGTYKINRRDGKGKFSFANGDVYEGDWKNNQFDGAGRYEFAYSGNVYEGEFKNGAAEGNGVMWYGRADVLTIDGKECEVRAGARYEGEFADWTPTGQGVWHDNGEE